MDYATCGLHQYPASPGYGPHIIIHVGRYMLVTLLEGCLICYLYFVFDQSSFAQVQVTACKQVLPFEQQLSGLFLL